MDNVLPAAEQAKLSANYLRGTLAAELQTESPEFSKQAISVLKFHGIYQQDDRDVRKAGPKQFSDMVRVGVPGGVLTPSQYLTLDRLADLGDGSLRITTRQDIQYHYIPKAKLPELMRGLNEEYLSTLAACGDVVRNVVSCPAPFETAERKNIQPVVEFISRSLKPKTSAYFEIWIDGERTAAAETEEPLYGPTYLPRKFKIAFAFPGVNTTDIYANDVGIVPQFREGEIIGYTVLAGGGMGQSAGVKASHPRLADPICSIGPSQEELLEVCSAIVTIHRDFGNRTNRKLARLKYVLDSWGVPKFKAELESRVGRSLADPPTLVWNSAEDFLGWHRQAAETLEAPARWFVGVRILSGRVRDFSDKHRFRSGLREIVSRYGLGVRLTCQQNLYLCGIADSDKDSIASLLEACGLMAPEKLPPVLRHAIACPALPTCGQAITESERILPGLVKQLQEELNATGLGDQAVHFRTSGCPNGCSRPYTAEIGIVGASVDMYTIYLGASRLGTRLGKVFATNIKRDDIVPHLRPILSSYKTSRQESESFGDFCHRTLATVGATAAVEATTSR